VAATYPIMGFAILALEEFTAKGKWSFGKGK